MTDQQPDFELAREPVTIMNEPIAVIRMEYTDPCTGCGVDFTVGEVAMLNTESTNFWCLRCVTRAYEVMMKADREGAQ